MRPTVEESGGEESLDRVRQRLQRARWRLRTAARGGPEWDAATAAVEELEAALRELKREATTDPGTSRYERRRNGRPGR